MQTPSPPRAVPFSLLGPDGETVIIGSHNDLAVARVSSRRLDRAEGEDHPCEGCPNSAAGEPRRATPNGCEDARRRGTRTQHEIPCSAATSTAWSIAVPVTARMRIAARTRFARCHAQLCRVNLTLHAESEAVRRLLVSA